MDAQSHFYSNIKFNYSIYIWGVLLYMNGTFRILLKLNFVKFGKILIGCLLFWSHFGALFSTKMVGLWIDILKIVIWGGRVSLLNQNEIVELFFSLSELCKCIIIYPSRQAAPHPLKMKKMFLVFWAFQAILRNNFCLRKTVIK